MFGRRKPALPALLALVLVALIAAACGADDGGGAQTGSGEQAADQPGQGKPALTLGTKDFAEEYILGELYAQALRAKGYTVNLKHSIGSTEVIDKALTSGTIDAYPEYTGETVSSAFAKDFLAKSPEQMTERAQQLYAERGQMTSEPTPFEDVDAIITLKDFAKRNGLSTVADLKKLDGFSLAGQPPFKGRFAGLKGMEKVYGITDVRFKPLPPGLQYRALDRGDVDTADAFTTDPQLASGRYTTLKDTEGVFGFQNVLFVINRPKYEALGGARFMAIVNEVNALLTEPAMREMNKAVLTDKKEPAAVAKAFLQANKLAGESVEPPSS
jgi:osmoprotectant transport system substrate-binding protein